MVEGRQIVETAARMSLAHECRLAIRDAFVRHMGSLEVDTGLLGQAD